MLTNTQKASFSTGKYRADVTVLGANATEQVHFWDNDGANHLLHSCSFPAHNLGRGAHDADLLADYTQGLLATVRRLHKQGKTLLT